jgi:RNA polymerase sigma factor (sigma-70 family)
MGVSRDARLDLIETVYRSRYEDFVRTASAIVNSRETGRDAVHDAFVTAIRRRRTYRNDGPIEAWIWRIVVRSALKLRPTRVERSLDEEPDAAARVESPAPERGEVWTAVTGLPDRQRLMLFLRYYGDLDYRTIATVTGVQIGTVGAELNAAHRSVRRYLEEGTHHARAR